MQKPRPHIGLRHIALYVKNLTECAHFYSDLLGMKLVWQPDADNYYFSSGDDNLALHRAPADFTPNQYQRLDHIGFFLAEPDAVDQWHDYLRANQVEIKAAPKNHRDGTRSFYCADPDGNIIQMIYYPTV
ncbi:MAG: VOC family protein [Gammaproteobacteria bacterium]|nr:VOC family protein [Gammaproteobacteria bacterium]MCW5583882.1 VOC family protein [Gammaproteobacteria bacterium]